MCTGPHTFQHLNGLDYREDVGEIKLRCIVWECQDLGFRVHTVILAETLDILLGALEVLNEESEPLGLRVSWVKTKIQAFNDILDAAILSVYLFVDVEMLRSRRDSVTLAVMFLSLLAVSQRSTDIWV